MLVTSVTLQPITALSSLYLHLRRVTTEASDWLQRDLTDERDVTGGEHFFKIIDNPFKNDCLHAKTICVYTCCLLRFFRCSSNAVSPAVHVNTSSKPLQSFPLSGNLEQVLLHHPMVSEVG